MKTVDQISEKVSLEYAGSKNMISPELLYLVAYVAYLVIKLVINCKKTPKDAVKTINNPWFFQRYKLKNLIRKSFEEKKFYFKPTENVDLDKLYSSFLVVGKQMKEEDFVSLQEGVS